MVYRHLLLRDDTSTSRRDLEMFAKFLKDESGATAIEYGLIAALVAIAAIGALSAMGTSISDMFTVVKTKVDAAKPTN
jgi:pilus assembly protein Flp/PilA